MKKLLSLLLFLPALACAQTAPFAFPIGVPASGFGGGGGGGSGPYAPTSYTANAILIGNGTGPILATGILGTSTGNALTALNSITAAASTDLTLNAGSGNQNVNLNATGTGSLLVSAGAAGYPFQLSTTASGNAIGSLAILAPNQTAGASTSVAFVLGHALSTRNSFGFGFNYTGAGSTGNYATFNMYGQGANLACFGTGNVVLPGLGTPVDNANGLFQIASSTSATAGIGFGSDLTLYRAAAGTFGTNSAYTVKTAAAVAGTIPMYVNVSGTETLMYVCVSAAQ